MLRGGPDTRSLLHSHARRVNRLFVEAIEPGAIVVAGSELTPAVCEVVDLVGKAVGVVVHLRLLPGTIDQYRRLVRRIGF